MLACAAVHAPIFMPSCCSFSMLSKSSSTASSAALACLRSARELARTRAPHKLLGRVQSAECAAPALLLRQSHLW